jgi:hypothetical protein
MDPTQMAALMAMLQGGAQQRPQVAPAPMAPGVPPMPATPPAMPSVSPMGMSEAGGPRSAPGLMPEATQQTPPMAGTYESPAGGASTGQPGAPSVGQGNPPMPQMKGDSQQTHAPRQRGDDAQRPRYPNSLPTFPRNELGALLLPRMVAQTGTSAPSPASAFNVPALGQFLQKLTA